MTGAGGLSGRRILVHVCGGIAVVKVPELLTTLRRAGAVVRVTMSPGAQAFIAPMTLQALAGGPVATTLLEPPGAAPAALGPGHGMAHLELGAWAEVQLVVPATADMCARLALGLADEVVGATALACPAPLVVAPAMEAAMWEHPATRAHLATLADRGARVVGPVRGRLASGRDDIGRLAPVEALVLAVTDALKAAPDPGRAPDPGAPPSPLAGTLVLVTAGGTREPIDPVRFLGNRSSGRMGLALAVAARRHGAEVVLVTAAPPPPPAPGLRVVEVGTAEEMLAAVRSVLPRARLVLMAAAVADWRVAAPAGEKLRRAGRDRLRLDLVPTPDILRAVVAERPPGCVVVGFAAETGELEGPARAKLRAKGVDLLVANRVVGPDSAMGGEGAGVLIVGADGVGRRVPFGPKSEVAAAILDAAARLAGPPDHG